MADKPKCPETPELEKLKHFRPEVVALHEFLDWLEEQGISLCKRGSAYNFRITESNSSLVHRFLDIDSKKVEAEREALIEYQRQLNEWRP